jgi:hypothetical protein
MSCFNPQLHETRLNEIIGLIAQYEKSTSMMGVTNASSAVAQWSSDNPDTSTASLEVVLFNWNLTTSFAFYVDPSEASNEYILASLLPSSHHTHLHTVAQNSGVASVTTIQREDCVCCAARAVDPVMLGGPRPEATV